jgi:hypothetical protein
LLLRKTRTQARIDGLDPTIWNDDDYAILDDLASSRVSAMAVFGGGAGSVCRHQTHFTSP